MDATAADRLLNDPVWKEATEAVKNRLVADLEKLELDGSRESREKALEIVRLLHAAKRYHRLLSAQVEHGKLPGKDEEAQKARYRLAGL